MASNELRTPSPPTGRWASTGSADRQAPTTEDARFRRTRIRLDDAAQEAIRLLELHDRPLDLVFDPAEAIADRRLVVRILATLMANAHRYAPPGDPIVVRGVARGRDLELQVDDAGPTIPASFREDMFGEPLRTPHAVLGMVHQVEVDLRTVAEYAQRHGGRAWVEDRDEGAGTSFRVLLADAVIAD